MKFSPKSEVQIQEERAARGPLARGVYDAEIKSATEKMSKAGNEMIEIELNVYDSTGEVRQMRDWVLEAMAAKLRHCAQACGLLAEYEAGTLDAWAMQGKPVRVKIGIDTKGEYPQNKVEDYVVSGAAPQPVQTARQPQPARAGGRDLDDDIPF